MKVPNCSTTYIVHENVMLNAEPHNLKVGDKVISYKENPDKEMVIEDIIVPKYYGFCQSNLLVKASGMEHPIDASWFLTFDDVGEDDEIFYLEDVIQ